MSLESEGDWEFGKCSWRDGVFSDWTVELYGSSFKIHRLAAGLGTRASEYFFHLFQAHDSAESFSDLGAGVSKLEFHQACAPGVTAEQVSESFVAAFREVVEYWYEGRFTKPLSAIRKDVVFALLREADFLGLRPLFDIVNAYILELLTGDQAINYALPLFIFASKYMFPEIASRCIRLASSASHLRIVSDLTKLPYPLFKALLLNEEFDFGDEDEYFLAIKAYITEHPSLSEADELWKEIRWGLISPSLIEEAKTLNLPKSALESVDFIAKKSFPRSPVTPSRFEYKEEYDAMQKMFLPRPNSIVRWQKGTFEVKAPEISGVKFSNGFASVQFISGYGTASFRTILATSSFRLRRQPLLCFSYNIEVLPSERFDFLLGVASSSHPRNIQLASEKSLGWGFSFNDRGKVWKYAADDKKGTLLGSMDPVRTGSTLYCVIDARGFRTRKRAFLTVYVQLPEETLSESKTPMSFKLKKFVIQMNCESFASADEQDLELFPSFSSADSGLQVGLKCLGFIPDFLDYDLPTIPRVAEDDD